MTGAEDVVASLNLPRNGFATTKSGNDIPTGYKFVSTHHLLISNYK